jgi:hypothetical protein
LPELLLAFVTLVMGFDAIRFLPYFAIFSLPAAARAWSAVVARYADAPWRRAATLAAALVPVVLVLCTLLWWGPSLRPGSQLPFRAGLAPSAARDAARRLHELDYHGGVFTEYEDGAYFTYAGRGAFLPVIDGRIDIYGEKLVLAYYDARWQPGRLLPYLDRFRVDAAVLYPTRGRYDELRRELLDSGAWREEPHDSWTLFLREVPRAPS